MTIEKVKQVAREKHDMNMTDEMAEKYIAKYSDKLGKLSDDELDNVAGGYSVCDEEMYVGVYCEPCGVWCDTKFWEIAVKRVFVCPVCGTIYQ